MLAEAVSLASASGRHLAHADLPSTAKQRSLLPSAGTRANQDKESCQEGVVFAQENAKQTDFGLVQFKNK